MTGRFSHVITTLGVIAGLGLSAVVLNAGDARYTVAEPAQRILYLRSGKVASRLMLSFRAVAADVYWIRTIQHYGGDRKSTKTTGRFELLQPLLDLTTTLDPQFNIAYRFGAVFLAMDPPNGPGRPDQAVALLEKGLTKNPGRWQYADDAGFVYYFKAMSDEDVEQTRADYQTSAEWFGRAAAMKGAPEWLGPLAAITRAQGGDRRGARFLLSELAVSPEEYIRKSAVRGLAQIDALDAIDQLQAIVDKYYETTHTYPTAWVDLVRARVIPGIPGDRANVPFMLDPVTHKVSLHPQSPLGPLPRIPAHQ